MVTVVVYGDTNNGDMSRLWGYKQRRQTTVRHKILIINELQICNSSFTRIKMFVKTNGAAVYGVNAMLVTIELSVVQGQGVFIEQFDLQQTLC